MDIDVSAHLRRCRDDYRSRATSPRVAWDCMGAAKWGDACDALADEIDAQGLTGDQAIGYLKAKAHGARTRADAADQSGLGIIVSLDCHREFDRIIDPIARDRRGWIELRGRGEYDADRMVLSGLPEYRRMLGVNQCVAWLGRESSENRRPRWADYGAERTPRTFSIEDADRWEARRLAWLGRYHPGIQVIHAEGGWERDAGFDFDLDRSVAHGDVPRARQFTPLYGTVAQHMTEPTPLALPCAVGLASSLAQPALKLAA